MTTTEGGATCYLERSEVRKILIGQPDESLYITEHVLSEVDALPIFTAADLSPDSKLEAYRKALAMVANELNAIAAMARANAAASADKDDKLSWAAHARALCEVARKALAAGG